ncbi:MAG: hypothetical protein M1817_003360 [Caeruleum heppii]|nr:MAG: hypothetical protein M1817_003360 [Caeruleum heppii]
MALHTYQLEHVSPSRPIHVALFRDVQNGAFLRQQLISGNVDFEYAFIDASTIISTTHALAAAFRALNDLAHDRLKTRNVHAEIVFSLSSNNNIADSFRRFGVGDLTTNLLVIKVSSEPTITHNSVQKHLSSVIEGTPIDFSDDNLRVMTDMAKVKKAYKMGQVTSNSKIDGGIITDERAELEMTIVGAMALRGAS